jgi:hypothetical protein
LIVRRIDKYEEYLAYPRKLLVCFLSFLKTSGWKCNFQRASLTEWIF